MSGGDPEPPVEKYYIQGRVIGFTGLGGCTSAKPLGVASVATYDGDILDSPNAYMLEHNSDGTNTSIDNLTDFTFRGLLSFMFGDTDVDLGYVEMNGTGGATVEQAYAVDQNAPADRQVGTSAYWVSMPPVSSIIIDLTSTGQTIDSFSKLAFAGQLEN